MEGLRDINDFMLILGNVAVDSKKSFVRLKLKCEHNFLLTRLNSYIQIAIFSTWICGFV